MGHSTQPQYCVIDRHFFAGSSSVHAITFDCIQVSQIAPTETHSRLLLTVLQILLEVFICRILCPMNVAVGAGVSGCFVFNDLEEVNFQVLTLALVSVLTPELIQLP
jgi:hypothetical protein